MTSTAVNLVRAFESSPARFEAYQALVALGAEALPAVREGLRSDNWKVRQWCAICLDRMASADALMDLLPLVRDPMWQVRMWAVHALGCNHCKARVECPVDVVPLLIELAAHDPHVRVRKMAVVMLSTDFRDPRAVPVLEDIVRTPGDRRLVLHAREGLRRLSPDRPVA